MMYPFAAAVCALVVAASQIIVPAPTWDTLPQEVSGSARGLTALHVDVAGAGELSGAALQLRHVGTPNVRGTGALGLGAGAAWGPLTLVGGYTWRNLPDPVGGLLAFGLSYRLSSRLRLGLGMDRLAPMAPWPGRTVINAGLLVQPHRTLSVSLGVDALNAPSWAPRLHMRRALRLGVGVRPLGGSPLFTVGMDGRMAYAGGAHFPDLRAVVDVAPYPGLHLLGAWHRRPDGQTVWAGVSVDLFGVELMGAGRAASPSAPRAADRMAWALTLRTQDRGALPINLRRHVDVQVAGTLRAGKQAPWQAEEAVALLPARLARLAEDDGVASVALYIDDVDVGLATVTELRNAIGRLRAQGKRVTAHLQVASTKAYLIAAAAEHITLDPLGTLDVRGMALKSHFYGDALKALGVRMEVVGVGRYKTAPDRYSRAEPRPEELEVGEGLVQQAYAYVLQVLDEDRGLSPEAAHQALASGPLGGAEAVRLHLVDDISPRVGAGTVLGPKGDGPEGEPLFGPGPRIALVAVQGMLSQDGQGSPLLGPATSADSVVRALGRAARDPDVAGVVLRIDSPGGDVLAAEEVYRAVHDFAARKPVAVSMGDVAASGGYWAAMGAPMIFAEPQTLTGSIGIYSMRADLSGLLERLAVHTHETKAGERAGAGAWERPMEADERAHEQAHLNSLYEMFVHKVAASRKLTQKRAAELAEGRVYTGADALALGLVDAMGGFMDAYQWVAQQAGVAQDPALGWQVPHRRPSLPALWGPWGMVLGDTSASENPWQLGATHARFLGSLAARPQALMPGWIMGTASLL